MRAFKIYHLDPETKSFYFYIKTNCISTNDKKIRCIYLKCLIPWRGLQLQIAIKIFQSLGYKRKPIALHFILSDTHVAVGDLSDEAYRDSRERIN